MPPPNSLLLLSSILSTTLAAAAAAEILAPAAPGRLGGARGSIWAKPTSIEARKGGYGISECKELYFDQIIDHFSYYKEETLWGGLWKQRYFLCDKFWDTKGPIFFYAGNEADVTLYLNNTGLMWENAKDFGALLLFAEHRYYGRSQPFSQFSSKAMQFLSAEQALADYATLLTSVKEELGVPDAPVVAFGGSYGGMLASWMRIRYPNIIAGAIAASAPVLAFDGDRSPPAAESFYAIVTRDASAAGGSAAQCADNVRIGWSVMWETSQTLQGLKEMSEVLGLCAPIRTQAEVWNVFFWMQSAWSYMAMGNYPYESSYILNGDGKLPAFPVRAACESLAFDVHEGSSGRTLLEGIRKAVGVYYNYSGDIECYDLYKGVNEESKVVEDHWSYQYCTEMFMPQETDGVSDMFWSSPWNETVASDECVRRFGVRPRVDWIATHFGAGDLSTASNIIFSNGALDPWSGTGVLKNVSDSVVALILESGAHHLDLMFSTPDDPPEVTQIRKIEMEHVSRWVEEHRSRVSH